MDAITILHLSDLQFGRHHRFGLAEPLLARLQEDLRGLSEDQGLQPDLLVVTGDLAESGRRSEFDAAGRLLEGLTDFLGLERQRVVLIPGNHDVNRNFSEAYFAECAGDDREPMPPYWPKWRPWVDFFHQFYRDVPAVDFNEDEPWSLFEIPELRVVVAGLNSTMAESHRADDHYGWLGEAQLRWFQQRLGPYRERGWLRIAAVHHNVMRKAGADDENLRDTGDLKRLLGPFLNVVLHGHVHDGKLYWLNPRVPILSTGGAATQEKLSLLKMLVSTDFSNQYHQYQVIQIQADGIRRWARAYVPDRKMWIGDDRISERGDSWRAEHAVDFEDVGETSFVSAATEPDSYHGSREQSAFYEKDDFLSRVERVCRLREEGAEIRRLQLGRLEYLSVSVSVGGIARVFPVGAVAGDVDVETLEGFLAVHRRYQQADSGMVSTLVYGGSPPSEEVSRRARAERVQVRSFIEYQGLLDFRSYVARQTLRLAADPVYPPELYVPQRLSLPSGREQHANDALETVSNWLGDDYGRFILILGDFGTGKTFLLHELARRLGEEEGALTPILIGMRELEKSRTLDELVAQHLARSGMERIDLKAFRYMLEQGRIALLFDGFDELALRVTYDRAAEHFSTLLEAARGDAKVVVTSRIQHFESDQQIRTALGERVELLSGHRIARLEPFNEEQIRCFLVNRLGEETEAENRFRLLAEIRDLPGLSQNPRMLGFITDLAEEDLRAATARQGEITAAKLYELLIERWLGYEYQRQRPAGALPALSVEERRHAVTQLALLWWSKPEKTIDLHELREETVRAIEQLDEGMSYGVAAHQVGSGTLLVRPDEGEFTFIHESIPEWLVARQAARELAESKRAAVLEEQVLSPLMADFLVEIAGRENASRWATEVIRTGIGGPAEKNAFLVLGRFQGALSLDLAGKDLRGQDFSGQDLSEAELTEVDLAAARLIGSRLRKACLAGADLSDADLSRADLAQADLRGADLSQARLLGADLRGARMEGSQLRRAKLVGARVDDGALSAISTFGAALPEPQAVEAWVSAPPAPGQDLSQHPDGTLIASGHTDGILRLWDRSSGREIRRFRIHADGIRRVAWSPDGDVLATRAGDRVRLWDPLAGCEIAGRQDVIASLDWSSAAGDPSSTIAWLGEHLPESLPPPLKSLAWSPDARHLAALSDDAAIRIWDVPAGREMRRLTVTSGHVLSIAWSPDGEMLATSSGDGTVRLRTASTGAELLTLEGHQSAVRSIAWSADGQNLATGSDAGTIRLWDVSKGREQARLSGHEDGVRAIAFSPEGQTLATGSGDGTIRLWDVGTGRESRRLEGHQRGVRSVAWSDDGRTLASGSDDRTVRIWDLEAGQERYRLEGHRQGVWKVAWNSDSYTLTSISGDGEIRLWDPVTGKEKQRIRGREGVVSSVDWCGDGATPALACADGTIRIWDLVSERELLILASLPEGWVAFDPSSGRYKSEGATAGAFWHTVGLCRFEPGELDPYLPEPLRVPDHEPFLRPETRTVEPSASEQSGWPRHEVPDLALPIGLLTWRRPERTGDFFFHFSLPGETVLLVAVDVAGHGPGVYIQTLFLRGWLQGWMRSLKTPPRLQSLVEDFSRELHSQKIDAGCYFALLTHQRGQQHTVSYEAVSYGFPPPLLLTGSPFRTLESAILAAPLPTEDLVAQPVRIDHLAAPWRLLIASDGLLRRLGKGNEPLGLRRIREWQTGSDRDRPPDRHLETKEPVVDDELFASIRWNDWDLEMVFSTEDHDECHRLIEIIGRRIRRSLSEKRSLGFQQAVLEAIHNAHVHGYSSAPGLVTVRFRDEEEACRAEVEDRGRGVSLRNAIRSSDGGFAVMRAFMDEVDARHGAEKGIVVSLLAEKKSPPGRA